MRFVLLGLLMLASALVAQQQQNQPESARPADPKLHFDKDVVPFLAKNCFVCHGDKRQRAGLNLQKLAGEQDVQKNRKSWENVWNMVRTGEMPPKEKKERPDSTEIEKMLAALQTTLNDLDCTGTRNVGRVTIRRLNRAEYDNTIRDLFGINGLNLSADFPADDVGYGFDNIGDVLTISPLLLEKYVQAAEIVLEQAITTVEIPKPKVTRIGNLQVFRNAGEISRRRSFLHSKGTIFGETFLEEGDYIIRAEVYAKQLGDQVVKAALKSSGGRFLKTLKEYEITGTEDAPQTLEFTTRFGTGSGRVGIEFLNPYSAPSEGEKKKDETDKGAKKKDAKDSKDNEDNRRLLFIRNITVEGPFNPPPPKVPESHKLIMSHNEGLAPREAAREILTRFATRAFRRPVTSQEIDELLKLYDRAEKNGEQFENCIKLALFRVLISPHFLFRVELDPPDAEPGKAYPINEYALASRLSYFLWSTMPDQELFDLAAKGQLRQNLEAQVQRMLKDKKSDAFVKNFAGQWLTLRKLESSSPDEKLFPTWSDKLRQAMIRETELFFEAILRENRSIFDFIDADFSFVNEELAKHYGIEGIKGEKFQRVKLPPNRGGILTQASILTLTSHPTRTAPVNRGKFVLDQILNTPPPPPPPDVPPLEEEKRLTGSLRKVLEMHRQSPICASCHNRMDPLGFAFENFDAIGRWRDKDGEFEIDPSGVLPDGQKFQGPAELKVILKNKKDLFSRCLIEKVLTYALGRGLEYYDQCAIDKIQEALERDNYRFSTLILEVAKSEPFQMRMAAQKGEKR